MNARIHTIIEVLRRNGVYVALFFVIFYSVGFFGLRGACSHSFFMTLTPFALLLSFIAILIFHQSPVDKRSVVVMVLIYIITFIIEAIGTNTGIIFGKYIYGDGLGIRMFNTPLMIGVNWIMLTYCTASVVEKLPVHKIKRIFTASLLMLAYDLILEIVAPYLGMWTWENAVVPLRNYIAWFIIAFMLQVLVVLSGLRLQNKVAAAIFACQVLFFLSLIIFLM